MLLGILVVLCFIPTADVTGVCSGTPISVVNSEKRSLLKVYSDPVTIRVVVVGNYYSTNQKNNSVPKNKILVAQSPLLKVDNKSASLICNYTYNGTGEEFRASLHKGTDSATEVCFISWTKKVANKSSSNSTKEFNCQGAHDKDKVIFHLWNMSASQTDIYFCKIEVMYPPPYVYNEKSNGTVIHVQETPIQTKEPPPAIPLWIMPTVTGVLAFYSMLITAVFINYWQKSKKIMYHQSDYMNMTPRHPPYQKNKGYPPYAPTRDYTAYRYWQP